MNPVTSVPQPSSASFPGWATEHLASVDTTQALARGRPAWSAVVADVQTAGRGQRDRHFVCDVGGLYLTAVVPFDGDAAAWRGFALAIGRGVVNALTAMGIEDLRLRWPNDLMIGPRKVGGILVEQDGPHTLLVGLGINITNRPWLADHSLIYVAGRLLDHTDRALTGPSQLLEPVLAGIRQAHVEFDSQRLAGLAAALNLCWGVRRHVLLEAAGEVELAETEGIFSGIDERGQVLLAQPDGRIASVPEHHIGRLVEVE